MMDCLAGIRVFSIEPNTTNEYIIICDDIEIEGVCSIVLTKKTGITRDLIIHPGETIADVINEREITQAELAIRTGVSPAYVSSVISGKKDISSNFAMALEYALDVPKSFWLNLQANYEAELLEYNESNTVSDAKKLF